MADQILEGNQEEDDYNQDQNFEEENQTPVESDNNSEDEEVEDLEQNQESNPDDLDVRNEEFQEEPLEEVEDEPEQDDVQAVTVLVRIRPLLEDEEYTPEGEKTSIAVSLPHADDRNKIRVIAKEGTQFESILECGYDRVLDMNTTQNEVFETTAIKPAVLGVAHGISACVFAYGQTSSGKTHTMLGNDEYGRADKSEMNSTSDEEWGVIPRAVSTLFGELDSIYSKHVADQVSPSSSPSKEDKLHSSSPSPSVKRGSFQFTVYCSMLQIYNEQLHDLLSSSALYGEGEPLKIRETEKQGGSSLYDNNNENSTELYVSGLSSFRVSNVDDVLTLLKHGAKCRAVRATEWNEVSSRSHAILQLLVETQTKDANGVLTIRRAKLSMVDLAGSEKMNVAKDAPTMSKRHLQELTSINKSLSCLGNVIAVLADKSSGKIPQSSHVPYRDSKLTRLLQDSLGGSTRTVVVACVCPASQHGPESISTLKFADRARRVMARISANEVVDDSTLLARAKLEIKRLQKIINMLRAKEASHMGGAPNHGGSAVNMVGSGGEMVAGGGGGYDDEIVASNHGIENGSYQGHMQSMGTHDVVSDAYTRQLRIENLKLKEENRKLKDKCKKMKSKKAILSDYQLGLGMLPPSGTGSSSAGFLHYSDAKNVNTVGFTKKKSNSFTASSSHEAHTTIHPPSQSTLVESLGKRVENLEMKRRLENEFNNPILPPKLTPFLSKYEHEYASRGSVGKSDSIDDDAIEIDMQINILKSMNNKIEMKNNRRLINSIDYDQEEGGGEFNTEKEVKMLDMLMNTHKQLRKDAFEEGDKLVSLRSEREELERQLKVLKGGGVSSGGGGGSVGDAAIFENAEEDENERESFESEDNEEKEDHNQTSLFETRSPKKDGAKHDSDSASNGAVKVKVPTSAPNSHVANASLNSNSSEINQRSNSVDPNKQSSVDNSRKGSFKKKKSGSNHHVNKKQEGESTANKSTNSTSGVIINHASQPIKVGVKPLIVGGGGEPDKNGLYHTKADIGAVVKLYSYRFDDYFAATIGDYDPNRKLHLCSYEGGDSQWHDLTRKRLVLLSRPLSRPLSSSRKRDSAVKQDLAGGQSTSFDKQTSGADASSSTSGSNIPEGVKMPPSIFGVRPSSKGGGSSSRPTSSNGSLKPNGISKEEASELLKNSPYLNNP